MGFLLFVPDTRFGVIGLLTQEIRRTGQAHTSNGFFERARQYCSTPSVRKLGIFVIKIEGKQHLAESKGFEPLIPLRV